MIAGHAAFAVVEIGQACEDYLRSRGRHGRNDQSAIRHASDIKTAITKDGKLLAWISNSLSMVAPTAHFRRSSCLAAQFTPLVHIPVPTCASRPSAVATNIPRTVRF